MIREVKTGLSDSGVSYSSVVGQSSVHGVSVFSQIPIAGS